VSTRKSGDIPDKNAGLRVALDDRGVSAHMG
jgi:hypothetical protein